MIYSVTVKPGSKKGPLVVETPAANIADPASPTDPAGSARISQPVAKNLTVYLREKPVDGAANTALIKILAEHFRVAKTCVVIKSGATSRHKLIEIL